MTASGPRAGGGIGFVMVTVNTQLPVPTPTVEPIAVSAAIITIANAILSYLPQVVAVIVGLMAIAYYAVQLWESKTIQDRRHKFLEGRRLKKIAKLQAAERIVVAQLEALSVKRAANAAAAQLVQAGEAAAKQKLETAQLDAQILLQRQNTEAASKD